jgi:hypothetical protein
VSSPWEVPEAPINEAIRAAENWLAEALGQRIKWNRVRVIDSQRSLSEWRAGQIGLIKEEVERLGWPWNDDYVYLAFVRGMGGYAGGIRYGTASRALQWWAIYALKPSATIRPPRLAQCCWATTAGRLTHIA